MEPLLRNLHIQRYPVGLLELLGAKTGGLTPALAEERTRIVVDATEYYAQSTSRIAQFTFTLTGLARNGSTSLIIPTGELWRVRSVTCYSNAALAAATTIDLQPCAWNNANVSELLCGTTSDAATAGVALSVGWDFRTPRIFPAGWRFGSFVRNFVIGTAPPITTVVDYDLLLG